MGERVILTAAPESEALALADLQQAAPEVYDLDQPADIYGNGIVAHLEERALPGFLISATDTVRSMRKLRRLAWRSQAIVVAGHDPEQWPTLLHAPDYYD